MAQQYADWSHVSVAVRTFVWLSTRVTVPPIPSLRISFSLRLNKGGRGTVCLQAVAVAVSAHVCHISNCSSDIAEKSFSKEEVAKPASSSHQKDLAIDEY
jgi:hypothetical protein